MESLCGVPSSILQNGQPARMLLHIATHIVHLLQQDCLHE
jgi:hypothetical protein